MQVVLDAVYGQETRETAAGASVFAVLAGTVQEAEVDDSYELLVTAVLAASGDGACSVPQEENENDTMDELSPLEAE